MIKPVRPFLLLLLHLFFLKITAATPPIPFQLAGNMIVVEASLDGISGNFIIDTGSPDVVLNSAYFKGFPDPYNNTEVTDIHGQVRELLLYDIREFIVKGISLPHARALVLDLKALEAVRGLPLLGIIGYSALRNFEIMFDFQNSKLTLSSLKKNGSYAAEGPSTAPSDSFDLKMCGHIPAITVHINTKTLRFGIDSGAETNMVDATTFKEADLNMTITDSVAIRAISKEQLIAPVGIARAFSIGAWTPTTMRLMIVDMQHIRSQISPGLDGLLGSPFLQKEKMAINYKRKKLYLWREQKVPLAAN